MARILIVDDEPVILKLLDYRLTVNGYDVIAALDGEGALEMARREKPDLAILDIALPGMDGYEVCESLKKDAGCSGMPVLMLTATPGEDDMERGIKAGVDACMSKPFEAEELLSKIKELLKNRRSTGSFGRHTAEKAG